MLKKTTSSQVVRYKSTKPKDDFAKELRKRDYKIEDLKEILDSNKKMRSTSEFY